MVLTWEKRQPKVRSPEELRSFYAIPLSQGNNRAWSSGEYSDSQSIVSQSCAPSDCFWALSNSSTSLFSAQTSTASSATSISDYKRPDALSPRTDHEVPSTSVTLHGSCYYTPDIQTNHTSIGAASEGVDEDLEPPLGQTESGVARGQEYTGGELARLKSLQLDTACQHCTNQHLGCDKARPRCWNCKQNNQQCYYHRDETATLDTRGWSSTETSVQACIDSIPWLDTLREHPYHSLERDQKLGRVGAWRLKSRRGQLFQIQKENPDGQGIKFVEEGSSVAGQLLLDSNSLSDEEAFPLVEVDDTGDEAGSPLSSSTITLRNFCPPNGVVGSSGRIIPLDLGASFAKSESTDSLRLSQRSALPSSECDSQAPQPDEAGDGLGMFPRISRQRSAGSSSNEVMLFYCVFCFERFGNRTDWADHELSQHLETQRDWICMPWGPVEKYEEDGEEVCVFCGIASPSASHYLTHEDEPCAHKSTRERTFRRRVDLEKHFWNMHGQREIPDYLNRWSFEPQYEDWYWQCGFCDRSMSGWTDRVRHIGNHFQEGLSMFCWDPVISAGPIDKCTGTPVAWHPAANIDQGIRRILRVDEFSQVEKTHAVDKHRCEHCNASFQNQRDAKRHNEYWHLARDVWLCPTKNDIRTAAHLQTSPLAGYLFPNSTLLQKGTNFKSDVCPYCGDLTEDIFDDYDYDIRDCFADWDIRVRHLKSSHAFDRCVPGSRFYRADQFLLHLVGVHKLHLNAWTKEIMDSCKRTDLLRQKVMDLDVFLVNDDESSIVSL